jgi:hypothetical protein
MSSIVLGTALLSMPARAADSLVADPLFAETDPPPLKATLSLPLTNLLRSRKESLPVDATLTVDGRTHALSVSSRGKSRLVHCPFPPLWLDFDKDALDGSVFEGQNKLKLVTHCKKSLAPFGYSAAEMLVYRMLNQLTDRSFRVRALEITYLDTTENETMVQHAFAIEHKKRLAKRIGSPLVEVPKVPVESLDVEATALIGLFQYMIGNTDYSFTKGPEGDDCCHNTVPLRMSDGSVVPVAYDFDATGFVNPPYATPPPGLGLRRVTKRRYRGLCAHNEPTRAAAAFMLEHKAELFALIEHFDDIPGLKRKRVKNYVNSFFKIIENESKFGSRALMYCRR